MANLELLKVQVINIIDKQLREAICKKIGLNAETAEQMRKEDQTLIEQKISAEVAKL